MECHFLNLRGSVFCIFALLWAHNTYALYGGRTIDQVPIEKLATNIERQVEKGKTPQERATLLINLGRLYGMAFAKATNSAPVEKREYVQGEAVASFGEWLNQSPNKYPHLKPFLPLKPAIGPKTAEHKKFLRNSVDSFREALKIDPENRLGQLGLAWTLIQSGEKEEAKPYLLKLLDSKKNAFNYDEFLNSGGIYAPLDPKTSSIKLKFEKRTLAEGSPFPLAIRTRLQNLNLPSDNKPLSQKLEGPIDAYLKDPSQLSFDALMAAFNKVTFGVEDFLEIGRTEEKKISKAIIKEDLKALHARHSGKNPFIRQIKEALSASEPRDCQTAKGIEIQFYESAFPLELICLSRLASKANDWGICKNLSKEQSERGEKYASCVTYVAFRSRDKSICKERLRGYVGIDESFSKFSYVDRCQEIVGETLKRKIIFGGSPRFFVKREWDLNKLRPGLEEISVTIYPMLDESVRFGEVKISPKRRFTALDGGYDASILDILLGTEKKRGLLKWRKTIEIEFLDKAGKKLSSNFAQVTLPFADSEAGTPSPDFKIEDALYYAATAEAAFYYASILDPEKDKQEIERIRQRVWVEYKTPRFPKRELTPLAVSLSGDKNSTGILNTDATVKFDLIGNGTVESWDWIQPNAAWLVYRSPQTSEPISAMHLFGNSTFWLFWQNGFQPLCALDSDSNKTIEGTELSNIYLWQDKNSNGAEDINEVQTLDSRGIVALDCRHFKSAEGLLRSISGATLRNGKSLPIVDVILRRKRGDIP